MSSTKPLGKNRAVLPFVVGQDKIGSLDLSEVNTALTGDVYSDIGRFSGYIEDLLRSGGYRYLVGGYGELRKIYSFSTLFDGPEPRRLHLGVDVWGPAGTPVFSPCPGRVHSAAWNGDRGNYGGTVIVEFADPFRFALFGHLSRSSVGRVGRSVDAGEQVGTLGGPEENGHWPPHLHFQLIQDLEGMAGDYPGVCRWSEKERYLGNCPDPAPLLGF